MTNQLTREIPKILWQTHQWDYLELPQNFLATSMTWRNLNPGWDYRYASATKRAATVKEFDETLYKFYCLMSPTTQADIWRYISVYTYGGCYADMDSICTMPLDYQISASYKGEELLATQEDATNFVNNANFMAPKNSAVIRSVIGIILKVYEEANYYELLLKASTKDDFWHLLMTFLGTSPDEYNQAIALHPGSVSFRFAAAMHGEMFKESFNIDYIVDYYGRKISYQQLAKDEGYTTFITEFKNF